MAAMLPSLYSAAVGHADGDGLFLTRPLYYGSSKPNRQPICVRRVWEA